MRLFRLLRKEDMSGVSGTGYVGVAVEFDDGTTVVKFQVPGEDTKGDLASYHTFERAVQIHGHGGSTVFEPMEGYMRRGYARLWTETLKD